MRFPLLLLLLLVVTPAQAAPLGTWRFFEELGTASVFALEDLPLSVRVVFYDESLGASVEYRIFADLVVSASDVGTVFVTDVATEPAFVGLTEELFVTGRNLRANLMPPFVYTGISAYESEVVPGTLPEAVLRYELRLDQLSWSPATPSRPYAATLWGLTVFAVPEPMPGILIGLALAALRRARLPAMRRRPGATSGCSSPR